MSNTGGYRVVRYFDWKNIYIYIYTKKKKGKDKKKTSRERSLMFLNDMGLLMFLALTASLLLGYCQTDEKGNV